MKKTPSAPSGSGELPAAWREALALLDQDLRRRGAAEKTRAPTASTSGSSRWAVPHDLAPAEVDDPRLRRYAAGSPSAALAPRTVARKLAALRACFRVLRRARPDGAEPGRPARRAQAPQRLPRVLKPADVAALLDRIPAATPLELRDRALFELAYACGLRAEELVNLDLGSVDFDAEQVRVEGKGGKTRFVPVGEPALRAIERYLERAARRARRRRRGAGAVPLEVRPAALDVRRAAPPARLDAPRRGAGRGAPARAAPLVRHPSAGGRRRPARDPGAARARHHLHDAGLHSGRVRAAASGLRAQPSSGLDAQGVALETNVKAIELKDLWRRYKASGDDRARERLVVAYSPLVKYVAGRMASGLPAHVEEADLISYGLIGLISAIERFDLEREIKFETYAIPRIKGAIIDELRSLDWVPRSVRARAREIERANAKLEHRLQRAPTDEEMASELDMTSRRVPGVADPDLQLDDRRARRAVDGLRRQRRPGLAARHAARPGRARPGADGRRDRAQGPRRRRDRARCPSARSS